MRFAHKKIWPAEHRVRSTREVMCLSEHENAALAGGVCYCCFFEENGFGASETTRQSTEKNFLLKKKR